MSPVLGLVRHTVALGSQDERPQGTMDLVNALPLVRHCPPCSPRSWCCDWSRQAESMRTQPRKNAANGTGAGSALGVQTVIGGRLKANSVCEREMERFAGWTVGRLRLPFHGASTVIILNV